MRRQGPAGDRVVILDGRPGRSLSALYRAFLARLPGGVYVPAVPAEERTLQAMRDMMTDGPEELGFDLDRSAAILAFGSPLLEGWGGPAVGRRLAGRFASARGSEATPFLIQAETRPSHTALQADRWLAIRPGSEGVLALGLAHALLFGWTGSAAAGALDPGVSRDTGFRSLVSLFPPARVAAATGLAPETVLETAALLSLGATLVIGGGDAGGGPLPRDAETAIAALGLLSGAAVPGGCVRPRGGLPLPASLAREPLAPPSRLEDLPDGSVRLLIVDAAPWPEALPWSLVERKLGPRAIVLSLSPFLVGHAARADFVLPAPAWLEGLEELPTPPGAGRASLALSPAILPAPASATDPVVFVRRLAAASGVPMPGSGGQAELISERVASIAASRRGQVIRFDGQKTTPLTAIGSAADLRKALEDGAFWTDEPGEWTSAPRLRLPGPEASEPGRVAAPGGDADPSPLFASMPAPRETDLAALSGREDFPLVLMPFALAGLAGEGAVPTVLSKLYRESRLRNAGGSLLIHPDTAKACGVREGRRAVVETPGGRFTACVRFDPLVRPGVVHVAAGPDPEQLGEPGPRGSDVLALCAPGAFSGTTARRMAPARLMEA
jgi:hypothetical protein